LYQSHSLVYPFIITISRQAVVSDVIVSSANEVILTFEMEESPLEVEELEVSLIILHRRIIRRESRTEEMPVALY
jgi:hypothetical protein